MFQYGYTNFQKKGYRFASENEFFHASLKNRNAKLAQLVNHVDTKHTAYLEAEPTAYLGIFTDLDSNQENQRYYFQRSGRILERNAGYAQGYVQDVAKENDEAFFREPFLQLLWVPFWTGQELVQLPSEDCDRYFPDVTVDAFHLEQNPIKLEQGLLLRILEELLKGHRLVLHIDQQGDQAPQYSLGVLRHIYECLPYAMRRNCGFATNVAPERFSTNIDADRLPGAVQLCLVDGDVELPGRVSGFTVLEMGETYPVADENREFLQMLTVDSDTRRNFFEMVQENYGFHHASMEEYRTMYQVPCDSGGKSVTGTHLQTSESLPLHLHPPRHPQRQDRENGHRCRRRRRNPDHCFHFACSVQQGGRQPQPACKALQFRRCRHRADPGETP